MNIERFREQVRSYRTLTGNTQEELAKVLGLNPQVLSHKLHGVRNARLTHREVQTIVTTLVSWGAMTRQAEARELLSLMECPDFPLAAWNEPPLNRLKAVTSPARAPRQSVGNSIMEEEVPTQGGRTAHRIVLEQEGDASPSQLPCQDWGEAMDVDQFYGREQELVEVERWMIAEHCRLVAVLSSGGFGKTALAIKLTQRVAGQFDFVFWRSLHNAPPLQSVLAQCIRFLSKQQTLELPESVGERLSLLLEYLRKARCLLVLDNVEALFEGGSRAGKYREGYEGYGQLFQRVGETLHQSCLLLISREKPAELRRLEGRRSPVRAMRLAGLEAAACQQLLAEHEVLGSQEERARLIAAYAGNPLALQIVAETIIDLFGGTIGQFLAQETLVFGSISDLLDEQVGRLSALEQTLLFWLSIVREPVSLEELLALLVGSPSRGQVLEALDSLRRRCLLELGQRPGSFTLHPVVLEYVTADLVEQASGEIQQGRRSSLTRLREHGLCLAQAKDYVRQTQQRLLLVPLLARLQRASPRSADVEQQVCSLLDQLRDWAQEAQGYGPANLVMVLLLLRGHLRGLDLSRLVLRGVPLQGVELQDANLSEALLRECVLTETFDAILALAISPNGHSWAAGGRRGEVRVWESGRQGEQAVGSTLHRVWQAHNEATSALAFSPDGRLLASGSVDGTLTLRNVESGALLWTGWPPSDVQSLAMAPDGRLLATGGKDATLRLWDLELGTQVQTLSHPSSILSLAWSPDGRRLATGDVEGQLCLWEIEPTRPAACVHTLVGHSHPVRAVAFAPDGRTLASASLDRTVKLWDVGKQGRPSLRQTLSGHTDSVFAVAWNADGRRLASGGGDHTIWLWDIEGSHSRTVLQGHSARVSGLAFTPDSGHLLSGSEDGTLRLWDVERGEPLRLLQGYNAALFDVDWSPDGARLASVGSDSVVTIWEMGGSAGARPPAVLHGHRRVVYGVAWSPDGRLLASSGWDKAVLLWDASTGEPGQTLRDPDHLDAFFFGLAWSPDGRLLASASSGATGRGVQVWEMPTRSRRWAGPLLSTWVRRLAWSRDGAWVVGGGDDGQVYVWDATDGTLLQRLAGQHEAVMQVAFSPDGTRLVSAGRSQGQTGTGELVVWHIQSWQPVRALAQQAGVIYGVAWSRDGSRLVSGSSDGRLRWWEVHSGECLWVQEAHTGTIHSLKVSPDGSLLASCGDDGAIRLWDLESGQYVCTLRRDRPYERVNITGIRGLTQAQKATLRGLGAVEQEANQPSPPGTRLRGEELVGPQLNLVPIAEGGKNGRPPAPDRVEGSS